MESALRRKAELLRFLLSEARQEKTVCADIPVMARQSQDSRVRIYVKRGALRRYARLTDQAAALPVAIDWDRRTDQRRRAAHDVSKDARTGERRQPPPFTWDVADFVVVEAGSPDGET
jgi:hypothetical protein